MGGWGVGCCVWGWLGWCCGGLLGCCVRVMLGTGGLPRLVLVYICIMCEVRFHSFGVLGFLWSLCVVAEHGGWCYTVGGGVSKLEGHLLKLARKEKKKSTDLEVGPRLCDCFFANNRWRSQGR
jgi:hypothetical protein